MTDLARQVLTMEGDALHLAAQRFDSERFRAATEIVMACQGKVIVTGAGTSGLVGRKLAATLTSTGTPALFLHPSDALHGDLGMVDGADVVIMVTNSGETAELLVILPYLRRRGVSLISIVGNLDSTVARASDAALDAAAEREACPLGLAPTCSSTVALATGDALAVLLLEAKGVTADVFALNHPSGTLGKRLTLRVRDVVPGGFRRPTVAVDAPLLDVLDAVTDGGVGAALVLDESGRLAGLVTDGDIRRAIQREGVRAVEALTARELMTANPTTVDEDTLAYEALRQMEDRASQISVVPVLSSANDGACVGIVRVHDIVRAGV